jgi:hypothetical protein
MHAGWSKAGRFRRTIALLDDTPTVHFDNRIGIAGPVEIDGDPQDHLSQAAVQILHQHRLSFRCRDYRNSSGSSAPRITGGVHDAAAIATN